jgi:hypothetical protein
LAPFPPEGRYTGGTGPSSGWHRGTSPASGPARILAFPTLVLTGINIRRYPNGKVLTKPSNDAVRIRRRPSVEVRAPRGSNADAVTGRLNPIIKRTVRLLPDRGVRC